MTGSDDKRKSGGLPAEWDAASYHRLSAPQFSWGVRVLERLRMNGDETVMDAGCGTGRLTAGLLERLPRGRVVAVDLSQNMLEEARSPSRRGSARASSSSALTWLSCLS